MMHDLNYCFLVNRVAELQEHIMIINKLKFNATKSEIVVMCAPHVNIKLSMPHIELGDTVVPVFTVAKNIGVFFDDAVALTFFRRYKHSD